MQLVKAAMIGDIVGNQGLETLETCLPALIMEENIDFVTVNGENAAEGFGMTESDYRRIIAAGADVVTSGNHVWEKREFWEVLETEKNMIRPANYPSSGEISQTVSGTGFVSINKKGINWIVINLQGREHMTPINCPFQVFDRLIKMFEGRASDIHPLVTSDGTTVPFALPLILVDFHAESSREKEALAYYIDGRVSLIAGTHTHVQTADEKILPKGSAYITDLGMTGNVNSVIGMNPSICIERARKQVLYHMEPAALDKPGKIQGVIAEIDAKTGNAVSIKRI
ncbi:MAG: YmdB family metallophosphoesterase [Treponema sp.]|nr:YmdB family metallophosphoesterase [Treponema sp.]MCL2238193.1 YmdB family metallophosphoesterase [Treponema sp.]